MISTIVEQIKNSMTPAKESEIASYHNIPPLISIPRLNCYWERSDEDPNNPDFLKPRLKEGDAGIDLRAKESVTLHPQEKRIIGTGFYIDIPFSLCGLLLPRSSFGSQGLRLTNTVGVIDFGYHNEVCANVENNGKDILEINAGERFCQLVLVPHAVVGEFNYTETFDDEYNRGGGFGSTGTK